MQPYLIKQKQKIDRKVEFDQGRFTLTAPDYVPVFHSLGVTCVVRFNRKCYDRRHFLRNNIRHVDLYYEVCIVCCLLFGACLFIYALMAIL